MGGGISIPADQSPLGNSHGNHALLHQQLVEQALTRRAEIQSIAERGASRYNAMGQLRMAGREVLREIQRDDREREGDEEVEMYGEDSRLHSRIAERNRERGENRSMAREDKPPPRKVRRGE